MLAFFLHALVAWFTPKERWVDPHKRKGRTVRGHWRR